MTSSAIALPLAGVEFDRARCALADRRIDDVLKHLDNAELAGYDPDECASGRWYCWMLTGDFERAWRESDLIAARGTVDAFRLWDGSSIKGKRVIIRCLHGFGDAIQFIRYARLLRGIAASVTVETHAELMTLFSGIPWIDRVVSWADGSSKGFNDWNQQIEIMELPRVFRTTSSTVPAAVPYLHVTPEAQTRSERLLTADMSVRDVTRPRVGLVWQSGSWNPARSLAASDFAAIAGVPGISLFSFQREPGRNQLSELRERGPIHDTTEHSPDIADTAADLMNMDLLITVDTMIAHLAGALGRNVWTMLPFEADWRWMLNSNSTPWYPTMRLFRQPQPGDWQSVLNEVITSLRSDNMAAPCTY